MILAARGRLQGCRGLGGSPYAVAGRPDHVGDHVGLGDHDDVRSVDLGDCCVGSLGYRAHEVGAGGGVGGAHGSPGRQIFPRHPGAVFAERAGGNGTLGAPVDVGLPLGQVGAGDVPELGRVDDQLCGGLSAAGGAPVPQDRGGQNAVVGASDDPGDRFALVGGERGDIDEAANAGGLRKRRW